MREQLEQAYAIGDHRSVRALAQRLLAQAERPLDVAARVDADELARARALLAMTAPDPFLAVVGLLGLGLMAFLVYNYVP